MNGDNSSILRVPNKFNYQGKVLCGKRSGYGTCTYQDGTVYRGDWLLDVRHGKGKCIFADGSEYEGDW